ncbi:hypothetical protein [Prosthecobacter sp.]|uniref:hypothetical protein n=1 Tax=Prosthecobacter sp. TaxID=1965333 RepID=UPI0037845F47
MSDTLDPALLRKLVEAANEHGSEDYSGPLAEAINDVVNASADGGKDAILAVCAELPRISSPYGAAMLAVWLGAMVENGHDPGRSFKAVRDTYLNWSISLHNSDDGGAQGPEGALHALENCGRSLVSHCMNDGPIVDTLRADDVLVQELKRLEDSSNGAMWLTQVVSQMSAELIVLNVEKQAGALVRYENIANCFHLFTLLQEVLEEWLPPEKRPAKSLMECARGTSEKNERDEARWHFTQPGSSETEPEPWVWGEASPSSIGKVDGKQVVILRPPIMASRGWGSGFFCPILHRRPPDVKLLHFLSEEEFLKWKERVQLSEPAAPKAAAEKKKPWWKWR